MDATTKENTYIQPVAATVVVTPRKGYLFIKRTFDVTVSLFALLLLSPVFLIVSLWIKLDSPGPVIHKRWCVGKNGPYAMLKFRTMVVDANNFEKYFSEEQLQLYLQGVKIHDDPRITRAGKFLRSTSIDELPQLINVLRGEMSLIGPRPVIEREADEYGINRTKLLSCRPGITGCWQVMGRGTIPFLSEEAKELQLYYVDHESIVLDVKLLIQTVRVVFSRKGAR